MPSTLRRTIVLTVVALGFATGAALHASMPPQDERAAAEVGIVPPRAGTDPQAAAVVEALRDRLVAERFSVAVVDEAVPDPRAFLADHPEVFHLVTDLRTVGETVTAAVYTRGTVTPKRFEPVPVETLVAQVRAFLVSREAVDMRLAAATDEADPYDRALHEGLRLMASRETAAAAVHPFEEAARLRPDDPAPQLDLALTYKTLGEQDLRRQHVEEGLRRDPRNPALLNEKALLRIMDGDLQGAVAILDHLPQDDPVVLWNLAYVYGQMDRMDQAKVYFQKVAELDADDDLSVVARSRFEELERKARLFAGVRSGLWVALAGLGGIFGVAVIMLVIRRLRREAHEARELAAGDRLAIQVQVGLALVSGLFSIVSVVVSKLLSGP